MYGDWKKLGAVFMVVLMVAVSLSACIGGGEERELKSDIIGETLENVLPDDMDAAWKTYFESTDFDGDGILYPDDIYLGRDDNEVEDAKIGGAYRGMTAEISDWDPIDVTDTQSDTLVSKINCGLVQYVPGTTDPMPDLAVAWEANEAGDEFIFYLREGVTFSNGEEFTADDVVFSWNRLGNPVYGSARINFLTDYVASYEALDDYTLKVTLNDPFAPFITLMTYTCFKVLPQDYVSANEVVGATVEEGVEKNWLDAPIGCGPWTLNEYVSGDHVTLDANPGFYAGRPYLDEWRFRFTELDDTIVQAWKAGQIDICGVPSEYWEEFNTDYVDTLSTVSELATYFEYFNCESWPFENKTLRQAVTMGIQRASVIETLFKGRYMPAHGILPPGMTGFSQELYDSYEYTYNPEAAKQLLDDAGIIDTDGDGYREYQGQKLKFEFASYVSDTYVESAKVWTDNLKELGIEMTYQQYDFGTLLQMADEGNYTVLSLGWIADYPDPENFFILVEGKQIPDPNSVRYDDPEVNAWIQELRTNPNPDERAELAYKIEQKIQEDCPYIWFFHSRRTVAIHDWLHGYSSGPMGPHVEKQLSIWVDEDHRDL